MNKQEILNEINKTKEHLANLEKKLEELNYKRWKPELNKKFWYIDSYSTVNYTCFMPQIEADISRIKNYNCFQTKEEAEAEAEKIFVRRKLEDVARRLNKGRKIDWDTEEQFKYYIYTVNEGIEYSVDFTEKVQGVVYCLDANFKDVAIQEIGEERLKSYLRGE